MVALIGSKLPKQPRACSGTKQGVLTMSRVTAADERVERAANFLREDRSGNVTSSLATQLAGFSAAELRDRNLQRRVLRKKSSSPEGIAAAMLSTECVSASEKGVGPTALASTASAASAV